MPVLFTLIVYLGDESKAAPYKTSTREFMLCQTKTSTMPVTISGQTGVLSLTYLFLYRHRAFGAANVPYDILEFERCWNTVERVLNGRVIAYRNGYPLTFEDVAAFLKIIGMVYGGLKTPTNLFTLLW